MSSSKVPKIDRSGEWIVTWTQNIPDYKRPVTHTGIVGKFKTFVAAVRFAVAEEVYHNLSSLDEITKSALAYHALYSLAIDLKPEDDIEDFIQQWQDARWECLDALNAERYYTQPGYGYSFERLVEAEPVLVIRVLPDVNFT